MKEEIKAFNKTQPGEYAAICDILSTIIDKNMPEGACKIWHGHPVWFLEGNPIVGYSIQKKGVRLMFWSGADFEEGELNILGKNFRDASIFYKETSQINATDLARWLLKSKLIQWDYKNIIKRKGQLVRLK